MQKPGVKSKIRFHTLKDESKRLRKRKKAWRKHSEIMALDKSRLKSRVGELDAETMKRIETALLISVGMKEESHGG